MEKVEPSLNEAQHSSASGLWTALAKAELGATLKLSSDLELLSSAAEVCFECGVEVPTLPSARKPGFQQQVAALFLKRALNDLRGAWSLVCLGYTSQAGCIAAAAFENSLLATVVVADKDRAAKVMSTSDGGSPWSVLDLCKLASRDEDERASALGEVIEPNESEIAWRSRYAAYEWLCKIKHPTLLSSLHDAFSASLNDEDFVVMAVPDVRDSDLPNKSMVLIVTMLRLMDAIRAFSRSLDLRQDEERVQEWNAKMALADERLTEAFRSYNTRSLAFTIPSSKNKSALFNLKYGEVR